MHCMVCVSLFLRHQHVPWHLYQAMIAWTWRHDNNNDNHNDNNDDDDDDDEDDVDDGGDDDCNDDDDNDNDNDNNDFMHVRNSVSW